MPTEFQKIMDSVFAAVKNVFTFIDDILVATRGTKQQHMMKVHEVLQILSKAGFRVKAEKCKVAVKTTDWLGFQLTPEGIRPIQSKVQGISDRMRPTNIRQLRSLMGAVNQLNKFIPNLATICAPLRPLLRKDLPWKWTEVQESAFNQLKTEIQNVTEIKHFQRNLPLRIICDASKDGLGAVLQQQSELGWQPICFASRFLAEFEQKYSINELELLAVIWAVENFRNYVYGTEFEIVSDHRALLSVLKNNRGNKTFSSRLTRWVDRLLPFQFKIVHAPGRSMGMADYLSRHPSPSPLSDKFAEELWHDWFTVNVIENISAAGWHRDKGPPPPPCPITEPQAKRRINVTSRNDSDGSATDKNSTTPPSSSSNQNKQSLRQIVSTLQFPRQSSTTSKLDNKMLSSSPLPPNTSE